VFAQFPGVRDAVSLHLVEVSPHLSDMQYSKLTGGDQSQGSAATQEWSSEPCYRSCVSQYKIDVHWYRQLDDVPKAPSFFLAHEFFDALPVHKFQVNQLVSNRIFVSMTYSPKSSRSRNKNSASHVSVASC